MLAMLSNHPNVFFPTDVICARPAHKILRENREMFAAAWTKIFFAAIREAWRNCSDSKSSSASRALAHFAKPENFEKSRWFLIAREVVRIAGGAIFRCVSGKTQLFYGAKSFRAEKHAAAIPCFESGRRIHANCRFVGRIHR